MIAAVATILNDADIAGHTITNLYNQGVDEIHVALSTASTDNIRDVLTDLNVHITDDHNEHHHQPAWINWLAHQTNADWIIPFDADEFWYGIATLNDCPYDVMHVTSHQMRDYDYRFTDEFGMGKVAYRNHPEAIIANGNHAVSIPFAQHGWGTVELKEVQFRSLEHLHRKCEERTVRLDPSLPYSEGTHQRVLAAMTRSERETWWDMRQQRPVVYDPVPGGPYELSGVRHPTQRLPGPG